jgi:hypothetical protein
VLGAAAVALVSLTSLAMADTASATPSPTENTSAQFTVGAPAKAGPGSPPSRAEQSGAVAAATTPGACSPTYGISVCLGVDSSGYRPDFYVNSLSGLPAGTRYDVLVVNEYGQFNIVKKGILDHTGHYGAWFSDLYGDAYTAVVVSHPSGSIVYNVGYSNGSNY